MEPEDRVQSTEYGARAELARGLVGWSMEYRGKDPKGAKVQSGAELLWKSGKVNTKTGRGVASPRPSWLGGQGEALPLPAGGARERQRAPTGSDTFRMPNEVRPHGALGWHAVPTLPRYRVKEGGRGPGYLQAARVVPELSIRQTLTAIRLRQHAVPTLPRYNMDSTRCCPYLVTVPTLPDIMRKRGDREPGSW